MLTLSLVLQTVGVLVASSAAVLGPIQSRRSLAPATRILDAWTESTRRTATTGPQEDDPARQAAARAADDWIAADGIARPFTWGDLRVLPLTIAVDTMTRGQRHSDRVAGLVVVGVVLTTVGSIVSLWA